MWSIIIIFTENVRPPNWIQRTKCSSWTRRNTITSADAILIETITQNSGNRISERSSKVSRGELYVFYNRNGFTCEAWKQWMRLQLPNIQNEYRLRRQQKATSTWTNLVFICKWVKNEFDFLISLFRYRAQHECCSESCQWKSYKRRKWRLCSCERQ